MFDKTCQNCSNKFKAKTKDYKYCTRSCAAKVNNKLVKKRNKEGHCKLCKKEISASRTYCKECFNGDSWRRKAVDEVTRKKQVSIGVISWRQRTKIKAVEYMGGSCKCCGYNKCVWALAFHHLNPDEKDFSIGGKSLSWEKIKTELDKCVLVCTNCHFEIHEAEHRKEIGEKDTNYIARGGNRTRTPHG